MYIAETGLTLGRYKNAASLKQAADTVTDAPTNETTTEPVENGATESAAADFGAFIQKALGKTGASQVSEEELFAGLIEQRLGKLNAEAADFYAAEKQKLAATMVRPNGSVPWEDVAKAALKATVDAGKVDRTQANQINGEAFAAAQLDSNIDALYDDRGSAADPTIAVSAMEAALLKMRTTVDQLESGELKIDPRDLDMPSNSAPVSAPSGDAAASGSDATSSGAGTSTAAQAADGSGGFVWKPISDSNGKLAVLVPSSLSGEIDRLEVHSALPPTEATKLAQGRYDKDTNGGRPTFRFDKPGEAFGENIHVVVFKNDGSQITYDIDDGGTRVD